MKKLILITCLLGSTYISAQSNSIETEINSLENAMAQAIVKQDTIYLKKVWAPNMIVNAPINRVVVGGQIKMVASGFIRYKSLESHNEKIMVKDNLVISMGTETLETLGSNYPQAGRMVTRRYTNIWQKQGDNWILIARQASNLCE
ncbi:nuclear transport factor 2 family protein [Aequorivita sp. H23M31]|uniref:Nuclear transport factor 2 family protein n=1 Tax=Aequorivita ciconiae TaxID=2494375 RepID=A0A410G0Z7_9FLAO|nr:nuclear transport factor 2 family protein [Aequorivita sp. H23M31]QAA80919.1 nuclear transport factor 2 family protein [Aequorivita sp. H23M31]